jgi:hypothetical protein
MNKEQIQKEFEELAKPLVVFLQKNYHPHAKIIIDCTSAEIVEGVCGVPFEMND